MYRLGGVYAYAAAERRETGKSTDLCSSLESGWKSQLARKLRLKVQVATSTSLYTARRLERVRVREQRDIVLCLQYHHFVGRCIIQDRGVATDKVIKVQPLDNARDDRQ